MYSVMLVDDDYPVLEFLSAMIPWNELGLTPHSTCKNGRIALEKAQESMPDIVITDIGMPYMDGIELIRELRQLDGDPRVVVLSCMDDFTYAQQAVKLMVNDYILKETISKEMIVSLLQGISDDLTRRDEEAAQTLKWKGMAENQKTLLKQSVLQRIANKGIPYTEWRADAEELGLTPEQTGSMAVLCRIVGYEEENGKHGDVSILQLLEAATADVFQNCGSTVCLPHGARDIVLVFPWGNMFSDDSTQVSKLGKLRVVLQQSTGLSVSFQYLRISAGIESFREGISQLLALGSENAFYLQAGDILDLLQVQPFTEEDLFLHYPEAAQEIREAFLEESADRLNELLAKWMSFVRERRFTPRLVKDWTLKLLYDNQMRLQARQQFQSTFSLEILHDTIASIDHIHTLESWAVLFFQERLPFIREIYQQTRREEIKKVKLYVDRHLNKKITLEEVAEYTHLNSSYFSRLFKKETGMSFIHYVTHTKMEHAKELLDQSTKSVEYVAEQLGYENKSYFTKLFKIHTGSTPGEFRGE